MYPSMVDMSFQGHVMGCSQENRAETFGPRKLQ